MTIAMSIREEAAAMPAPRAYSPAEAALLHFERNAYRDRCHALERMVAFLLGREPEPAAIDHAAQLEAQRNAALDLLAQHTLPAAN